MVDQGYKKLEIYKLSHELSIKIHQMTLTLPKFETYEEGSQIRRSSKSVAANIVEGYCLRKNKGEFLQYLNRSYASSEETIEHLEILFETKSLTDINLFEPLRNRYEILSKMIFKFILSVSQEHERPLYVKEQQQIYEATDPNL